MSKLHLINEITTTVKMASENFDHVKLQLYLDDLLSNYQIEAKDFGDAKHDLNYISMYLDALKVENYSPLTLQNYAYELNRFTKFLGVKSILKASTSDVRAYLSSCNDLMQSTIVSKFDIISSFYSWMIREEELLKNPCAKISRPKLPKKVREGLTTIELELVRGACTITRVKKGVPYVLEDVRKRALIEVLYSTACRLDELHKLNREDIDWNSGSVTVCGKGNKERKVFLSDKARFYLDKYLKTRSDNCEALFTTERTPIRRLTHSAIQFQIKIIAKQANIQRSLHPHIFRHTFAQQALNAGMPMEDLQVYLGHEKADTTMRYASVTDERKYNSFKRYHVQ